MSISFILYRNIINLGIKSRTSFMIDDDNYLISDSKVIVNNFQSYSEDLSNNHTVHRHNTDRFLNPDEDQIYTVTVQVTKPCLEDIEIIVESLKNKEPEEDKINLNYSNM